MYKHILACVDGSEPGHKAAQVAGDLAERYGASLTLLCVWSEATDFTQDHAYGIVDHEAESLDQKRISNLSKVVAFGDAARSITDRAEKDGIDLIVIGSRGRSRVTSLLLGSVSQEVAGSCSCTCMIVR